MEVWVHAARLVWRSRGHRFGHKAGKVSETLASPMEDRADWENEPRLARPILWIVV